MIPLISKIFLATFPCIFFSTFHIFFVVLSLHEDEELHLSPLSFNLWPYLFVPVRHLLCLLFRKLRCLLALSLLLRSFSPYYCQFFLLLLSSSALFFLLLPKEGCNYSVDLWSFQFMHSYFSSETELQALKHLLSIKVGEEDGKAKIAPMMMKVRFMLQVPRDDIKSSALTSGVKRRWDI